VRPPNGGRNEAAPAPQAGAGLRGRRQPLHARWLYVTMGYTNVVAAFFRPLFAYSSYNCVIIPSVDLHEACLHL